MSNVFGEFFKNHEVSSETEVKPEEKRVVGKIIKVSEKGWGFISSKDIEFTRIFFHWTSLKQDTIRFPDLKPGMKVEFTPVNVEGKGWRAIRIKVIEIPTTTLNSPK
jgi:cold shock CspA family protein